MLDPTCPAATSPKLLRFLTAMLEFFAGRRRWIKGSTFDMDGNRCLVGARRRVQGLLGIEGEDADHYLRLAVAPFARLDREPTDIHLTRFNDCSAIYGEVRALIVAARDRWRITKWIGPSRPR
jgi:hypothetical protein